ncbi:MAG: hypothetical protein H7256_07260 [Bdellovibrio sp.]|nr:hypothetical protein [Bdellovibrio sp.]
MKKKFVSSIVFMMLVVGFQARAQEVALDKGVAGVENEDTHSVTPGTYTFSCESVDSENPLAIKIKNSADFATVILEGNESGFAGSTYKASMTFESSSLFKKYDYKLLSDADVEVGSLAVVYSKPLIIKDSCGRGSCLPIPHFIPKCGRGGCDDDLPIVNPVTKYKGILKMHEKEITFTCQ